MERISNKFQFKEYANKFCHEINNNDDENKIKTNSYNIISDNNNFEKKEQKKLYENIIKDVEKTVLLKKLMHEIMT